MIEDKEKFDYVEQFLIENGTIAEFEKNHGKIKGRMMITLTEIPDELNIEIKDTKSLFCFKCSFDFYNTSLGIALYVDKMKVASPIWLTPQVEGAEAPNETWIEFFIKTLAENIAEGGIFGIPMYTFTSDNNSFTVVPTHP